MSLSVNPFVAGVEAPPISEAATWVAGRDFPADAPLIDVAQAVPEIPPEDGLAAHMAGLTGRGDVAVYTAIHGLPDLRAALADDIAGLYRGGVGADDVFITAGCNQAFYVAMTALAKPGDEVILAMPWYFNHKMTLDMLGVATRPLPCRAAARMLPDPAEAAALIGPDTRAIVLVSPNNPTGAVYPSDLLADFLDVALANGVALVVDETYRDFLPPETARPHGLFARPDWREAFVHLYSFSKVYCLAGYRVGAVVADPGLLDQIAKVMDCLQVCAPHVSQLGALYGIRNLADWRAARRADMAVRLQALRDALAGGNHGYEIAGDGAYFAYLRHPFAGRPAIQVAKWLAAEHNLLMLAGSTFGPDQEDHLRVAFANVDAAVMPAIADRLAASARGDGPPP